MRNDSKNITPQTLDNQLVEWRKKFSKEIPERVGLAFYTNEKGETEVEVYFADDNMWLSRETMGQLFDVDPRTISDHITNIYKSSELDENPTRRKIRRVQTEGNRQVERDIDFYNLDLVISVGKILKTDVTVAKNYLEEDEMKRLKKPSRNTANFASFKTAIM